MKGYFEGTFLHISLGHLLYIKTQYKNNIFCERYSIMTKLSGGILASIHNMYVNFLELEICILIPLLKESPEVSFELPASESSRAPSKAGNTLELIGIGKDFFSRTPAAQQQRERMDKWDFIKLKSFCTTKEMVSKLKRPPIEWEKTFASYISDKDCKPEYTGNLRN
jgi:hypothetical protein